ELTEPVLGPGEKTLLELQGLRVEDVERPEVVSLAAAMEKQHVNRLHEQEEALNTVMFQNRDGSTTTYIYTVPVKYVSEDGSIKDKSTAITASTAETGYSYAMTQNDVKAYFGNALTIGVRVKYGEYSVTMKPAAAALVQPTVTAGGNTVLYEGVFGTGTAISYETQLSGVKEDIILYSNVGKNTFSFTLTTNGLTPALIDGVWCLLDARDATLMKLGEILITDSAGNTTLGSMSIEANVKFGGYTLTVTAPEEFLNADTTVYPVYVDPTITITTEFWDDQGIRHETIADMGRYETQSDADAALADPGHHVLKNNFSEIFYVFPDFYEDYGGDISVYGIEECDIGNVSLHLYMEPGDACTITAKPLNYDLWFFGELPAPIAVYEPNIANMSENANVGVTSVPAATAWATYEIDITEIARGWARYMQGDSTNDYENPANGFVLKSNGTTARKIRSAEHTSYSLYYTVDRENGGYFYLRNVTTDIFLKAIPSNNVLSVSNSYVDDSILQFVYRGDGKYFIKMGSNPNLFLHSSASTSSPVTFTEAPESLTNTEYLWRTLSGADGGVIIQNVATGKVICGSLSTVSMVDPRTIDTSVSFDSDYHETVWYPVNLDMFVPLTSFTALVPEWVEVNATVGFSIIPTPIDAMWTSDVHFQCTSSNPDVIEITDNGSMVAVGEGFAIITVQHKAFKVKDTCVVT
ncbi:MAG: hypothetical protein IJX13_02090, partial [Clostridia bacterium]|nr:hypothetical protein [Clostridia bacterium]